MHTPRVIHRFGPFTLDPSQRRLFKGDEPVSLSEHPLAVLMALVSNPGKIVDKDSLVKAAWADTAVSDDSLRQAVSAIRDTLGRQPDGSDYVETRIKLGYQFIAPVECTEALLSDEAIEDLLGPFRAFVNGRAALQSLNLDRVNRALDMFERLVKTHPKAFEAHVGLATACFLIFESTRTAPAPNVRRLLQALQHAKPGVRLNPGSGDAWGTLALVMSRTGETVDAIAAARKAVDLEPSDWLHHLRHAAVSWGQERIRAAHRALELNPDLTLAHWLVATVFVARGQLDRAHEELRLGSAIDDAADGRDRLKAVGLHWLLGLVLAALGRNDEAVVELKREIAVCKEPHVFGMEACVNASRALAFLSEEQPRSGSPSDAWRTAGIKSAVSLQERPKVSPTADVESAIVKAVELTLQNRYAEAARACEAALQGAPPGSAGWLIPVEPTLHHTTHRKEWKRTLDMLRARAA